MKHGLKFFLMVVLIGLGVQLNSAILSNIIAGDVETFVTTEFFQPVYATSCSRDSDCNGYDCHDATCRTSCGDSGHDDDDDDCASGYECVSDTCQAEGADCASLDCGAYDCHDGACRTSCSHEGEDDDARCASGYECSSGACVRAYWSKNSNMKIKQY